MKVLYEGNDTVRCTVRCLAALSHVPVDDVVEAFELLVESMPPAEHMDELVSYFEHTNIRGRRQRGRGETKAHPVFPSTYEINATPLPMELREQRTV